MPKKQAAANADASGTVFIVAPSGAVHAATAEHARARIGADRRFRYATDEEIAAYQKADGYQTHETPLGARWTAP